MRVQFKLDRDRDDPITIMFYGSLLANLDRKYVGPVVTKIVTSYEFQGCSFKGAAYQNDIENGRSTNVESEPSGPKRPLTFKKMLRRILYDV